MKLSIYSGFAITTALLLSAGIGCSRRDTTNTAADRPDTATSTYADRGKTVSSNDRDFAMNAAEGGMAEVEMGRLAQQQSTNQGVKDYGKQLVDDHTKANDDLKDVASKEGIALPTVVNSKQRDTIDKLAKLSGAKFDKEFVKQAVDDHRNDISEFQKEANKGDNQSLRNFASSNLGTLQDHLNTAQTLSKSVK